MVKPPPFRYHRPVTIAEATALLAEHGDDAKVLAGGQSLIPLMALRMGRPAHVVDIGRIDGLDRIDVDADGRVTLGALVRHEQAKRSDDIARFAPLVAAAMPWVAHRAIRTRGTVVGSIAHADPAAEMPAVVLATSATMVAVSVDGRREIGAADFFRGYLDTALRPDEILAEVVFDPWPDTATGVVTEVARRHGDYALVGLAARLDLGDDGTIAEAALAFFGAASTPVRASDAENLLVGSPATTDAFERAADAAMAQLAPPADLHGSTAYRRHLVGTLTRRGLADAMNRIGAPA